LGHRFTLTLRMEPRKPVRWLRQHAEDGKVLVMAQVSTQSRGYALSLVDAAQGGSVEPLTDRYASRDAAFKAADSIVRSRYVGHACGAACSGWAPVPSETT
jgi:hypothetical protein